MKIRENTILVKKDWEKTDSNQKKKIKEHFEKFGKCQIYFGWLYDGEEGAEVEFETKDMQEKAMASEMYEFDFRAAPEPPKKEEIEEMEKKLNVEKKKLNAALYASKNSGK